MKTENGKQIIAHNPQVTALLASHKNNPEFKKILDTYDNKIFKVSDIKVSYRTITSWEKANLLLSGSNKNEKWRKFSIVEALWLQIVKELRDIGFSTKKILKLKDSLFRIRAEFGKLSTSTFCTYLFSFKGKRDVVIVIDKEGNGDFALDIEYELSLRNNDFPNTHTVLSLNKIYADFSGQKEYRQRNQYFWIFDDKQIELLNAIYNDPYLKEVTIKAKDGAIDKVNFKRQEQNPKNVVDAVSKAIKKGTRREIGLLLNQIK